MDDSFASAIKHHLELKQRNRRLDDSMPLERYRDERFGSTHALFVSEETARREERWSEPSPDSPTIERGGIMFEAAEELWSGPPSFDWGD